jgi:hypothetical protein
MPIPDIPGFDSRAAAKNYTRENVHLFKGIQFMIFKALEIGHPKVNTTVELEFKPRNRVDRD